MRISDWSSDVCSSDLVAIAARGHHFLRSRDLPCLQFVRWHNHLVRESIEIASPQSLNESLRLGEGRSFGWSAMTFDLAQNGIGEARKIFRRLGAGKNSKLRICKCQRIPDHELDGLCNPMRVYLLEHGVTCGEECVHIERLFCMEGDACAAAALVAVNDS